MKTRSRKLYTLIAGLTSLVLTGFLATQPLFSDVHAREMNAVFDQLQGRIQKITLPNGLRLILLQQHYAPTVAAYIKFQAGSADETPSSFGVAHMLEHMLFKGTRLVGTRDWSRESKYHWQSIAWMRELDQYRHKRDTILAQSPATNEQTGELAGLDQHIRTLERRLAQLQQQSRIYVIPEEDSQLYSMHGQKGYNAYTMSDLTNYQIELPSNRLEVWARIESDRLENAVLRDFYPERNVVASERRMRFSNSPVRALFEQMLEQVYPTGHPYAHSVIGPMPSIQYLNYDKAMRFYRDYYAPNNSVIALVGEFNQPATIELVRRYFGKLEARTVAPRGKPPAVDRRARQITMHHPGQPVLVLAWLKPPMPDPADATIELLGEILADGRESRLYQRLVVQEKLASAVSAYNGYPGERYTNLFLIQIQSLQYENYDQIAAVVQQEIDRIRSSGVQKEEVERVRQKAKAELIYQLRSNSFLADQLSYSEIQFGDYKTFFSYYSQIDRIQPESFSAIATRYLSGEQRIEGRILPPEKQNESH
ncbi:MAG: insulinase family protein [Leptospiraceae bacterium]|nr:insulinase family protein [Leptospiraceae bacterium]